MHASWTTRSCKWSIDWPAICHTNDWYIWHGQCAILRGSSWRWICHWELKQKSSFWFYLFFYQTGLIFPCSSFITYYCVPCPTQSSGMPASLRSRWALWGQHADQPIRMRGVRPSFCVGNCDSWGFPARYIPSSSSSSSSSGSVWSSHSSESWSSKYSWWT